MSSSSSSSSSSTTSSSQSVSPSTHLSLSSKLNLFFNRNIKFSSSSSVSSSSSSSSSAAANADANAILPSEVLFEFLYSLRQVLALVFGLSCGCLSCTGVTPFLLYLLLSSVCVYTYYSSYLASPVDEEELGRVPLLSEGLVPSVALFFLCWITVYSLQMSEYHV